MIRQTLTIAQTTFIEAIRQPVYLVLLFVGVVALVLAPSLAAYTMESNLDDVMLIDMGLSNLGLCSILIAVLVAATVLAREIEVRTVLTVVSKPVPRPIFILGKYLGVAVATILAYYIMSLIFLLTVRHGVMWAAWKKFDQPVIIFGLLGTIIPLVLAGAANYFSKRSFVSTFIVLMALGQSIAFALVLLISPGWSIQSPLTNLLENEGRMIKLIAGMGSVLAGVLLMTSLALACATRLNVVPTLLICFGIAVLGITSGGLNQWVNSKLDLPLNLGVFDSISVIASSDTSFGLKSVYLSAKGVYLLAPNLQFLWPSDAVVQGKLIPLDHLLGLVVYAGLYVLFFLGLATALFQRREVG